MLFKKEIMKKPLINEGIQVSILETGNIGEINKDILMLNQLHGNNLETTAANIFLRIERSGNVLYSPLIGVGSNSKFIVEENQAIYDGEFEGIEYQVVLSIIKNAYFFDVLLKKNPTKDRITVFYGMDTAVSNIYALRNNEAYVSQYVDHQAFLTDNGYVVCSRQNQGEHTYLEQGSLTKNIAYSTDGFQFFGLDYKFNGVPQCILDNKLPSEVYQYEFGYIGLQTETFELDEDKKMIFYGIYLDNMQHVVSEPKLTSSAKALHDLIAFKDNYKTKEAVVPSITFNNIYSSRPFTKEEIDVIYPKRNQEEYISDRCQSFFLDNCAHVVLQEKEKLVERPSGQVLISGNHLDFEEVLASTTYIFGVFSSQIVLGNTSFNKLSSNIRNALNAQRISGQRIFVKIANEYKLLGMPASYEMGLNYSKWYYVINDDILEVVTFISDKVSKMSTTVKSHKNIKYDFIMTNYITMAQNEHESPIVSEIKGNEVTFKPAVGSMAFNKYPDLYFKCIIDTKAEISDDRVFYSDKEAHGETMITYTLQSSGFTIQTIGSAFGEKINEDFDNLDLCVEGYTNTFTDLLNGFHLTIDSSEKENIESFNYLAYWYTQNALVHFTSPHGLEQYNGAAWGTRDVCQGPAEYFLTTQNFDVVKLIIKKVFAQQYIENGNWPQWFMFDRFSNIQQHESHGDIIVWPARLVALYLESTKDFSILEEEIPYTSMATSDFTKEKYTLMDHIENEIDNIVKSFVGDTHLSCYGGGDWDDTLQPAQKEFAAQMVSGWTVALTYETLKMLGQSLVNVKDKIAKKYSTLAQEIKQDYNKYVIKDGIPAGFLHFTDNGIRCIIHPTDSTTNMKYRLLPFNRGIISEMFDLEQKDTAFKVIDKYLKHPDGVRLMDKTVAYKGGENTYFTRAETAANFGREIGLQYCHAHIRYCEALAKAGKAMELYKGLLTIQPVKVNEIVKNAMPRQRNAYFSSSDGNFLNRYEAMRDFDKLRDGSVKVKGGWRVYSSGPGIYMNQLVGGMLGIRMKGDEVVIDPVLPKELSGLKFTYKIANKKVNITYTASSTSKITIDNKEVPICFEEKVYRHGGCVFAKDLIKEGSTIEVFYEVN